MYIVQWKIYISTSCMVCTVSSSEWWAVSSKHTCIYSIYPNMFVHVCMLCFLCVVFIFHHKIKVIFSGHFFWFLFWLINIFCYNVITFNCFNVHLDGNRRTQRTNERHCQYHWWWWWCWWGFLRRLTHPRSVWNGNRFIKAALTVYKIWIFSCGSNAKIVVYASLCMQIK